MKTVVTALVVLALQWGLASRALVGCASPDLPLAFAVAYALHRPKTVPLAGLWAFGLAVDLLGSYPTGFHAIAFPALGAAAASAASAFEPGSAPVRAAALLLSCAVLRAAQWSVLAAEGAAPRAAGALLFIGGSAVLTAAVGAAFLVVWDLAFRVPDAAPGGAAVA